MPEPAGLDIGLYEPRDSDEALELERQCPQGERFRLSFRRDTFHRRAENFPVWRIFTARLRGRLVGTSAVALKDAALLGHPVRASFYFDLRVHPEHRGRGIGGALSRAAWEWGRERSEFAYFYTVAGNRAARHMGRAIGGRELGGYSYLIYPVYRRRPVDLRPRESTFRDVHDAHLEIAPPYDFYSSPAPEGRASGYRESWLLRRGGETAGCSLWSNRGILGEVVESMPLSYRAAGAVMGSWPMRGLPLPHVPEPGEELSSWYVFDFFATDPGLSRGLMRHVADRALSQGIDYCHLPHDPGDPWVDAVRSDVCRLFAPVLPYRLVGRSTRGETPEIGRIYVDVRDL